MRFHFPKIEPFPGVPLQDWQSWTWQMRSSFSKAEHFAKHFALTESEINAFAQNPSFQVKSTPYYVALSHRDNENDPIRKMILPRQEEFSTAGQQVADPLGEHKHSPVERVVHRYPDRALFLVTDQCSLYCRYCFRKHFTGQDQAFVGSRDYENAIDYFKKNTRISEAILTGGDPMTLSDGRLDRVLSDLRKIDHIEVIRIGTRMPVVCPMRFTPETVKLIRKSKPVYIMSHFNHPHELSEDAAACLESLVDHGVPIFNQMVLLNGINNHPAIVFALSRRLLFLRVKPYYMFQCDPSQGSEHFRTKVDDSLAIQRALWGKLSGLAMPNLSLDIPGGGGKVGLVPDFEISRSQTERVYRGWDGVEGIYQEPGDFPVLSPADVEVYMPEMPT